MKKNLSVALSKQIVRAVNKADWDGLEQLLEELLLQHTTGTKPASFEQLVAGSKWMLDAGKNDLCLRLCQAALLLDAKRFEAAEVLFFLFLNLHEHQNAKDALVLTRKYGPQQSVYDTWEILLYNDEGNSRAICELFDAGKITLNHQDLRLSEVVFSVVMALIEFNRLEEAASLVDEFYPTPSLDSPNELNLHAKMHQAKGNFEESIKYFTLVQDTFGGTQSSVESRWNKSLLELSIGDLVNGWKNYESRWEWERFTSVKIDFSSERWSGQDLTGRSIIIWGEQGIGDEILFLTLLPELFKLNPGKVLVFVSRKIAPIIEDWYPEVEVFPVTSDLLNVKLPTLDHDFHLPCGSLPLALNCLDVSCPKRSLRHTTQIDELKANILSRFPGTKRIIGLSWRSGSLTHKRLKHYVSHHAVLDWIRDAPSDILFLNLQYGLSSEEEKAFAELPNFHIADADFFDDVMAQAQYIQCCDLVVTSASVCLALAGVSAVPCVTWGPKRNWTLLGSDRYPWFPLVHLIPCEMNWDLGSLVLQIKKLLHIFYRS